MEPVSSHPVFQCRCSWCDVVLWSDANKVFADLDGEPFKAYFCLGCATTAKQEAAEVKESPAGGIVRSTER